MNFYPCLYDKIAFFCPASTVQHMNFSLNELGCVGVELLLKCQLPSRLVSLDLSHTVQQPSGQVYRHLYNFLSEVSLLFDKNFEGSAVVECLTRDRRALGSSRTFVPAFRSLSKTHLSQLSTGSTQEDLSLFN